MKNSKCRTKTKTVMIDLAISCCQLTTSLRIESLQITSTPWSSTPRKQFNNFKHAVL